MNNLPDEFVRTRMELYGKPGAEWVRRLPALIAECERRWSLNAEPPFPNLSYNYVAPAVRRSSSGSDVEVILKLSAPTLELTYEIGALRLCNGHGIVQLLERDAEQGAMLLEQLRPGAPLAALADDVDITAIAARVMRQIWRPLASDHGFPTVADWAAGLERMRDRFDGGTGPLPTDLVEEAESLFAELISSSAEPVLLHGDLHHDNILAAERQPWLAIDPKGLAGEREYEVGAFLRNYVLDAPDPGRLTARRIDQFAEELGFDRARVRAWGLAQSVLSAWWSIEDHGYGWEDAMACAALLSEMGV